MTVVSVSYILFAPRPEGFGLDHTLAVGIGWVVALTLWVVFCVYLRRLNDNKITREYSY